MKKKCSVTYLIGYQTSRETGGNPGWSAEYRNARGDVIDDSEKIGHARMPVRKDAEKKAERLAKAHARKLCRR